MLMSSMVLSLRAIGERWEVSLGAGVIWYWTLGVHLTEKNLDPGGAPLRNTNKQEIFFLHHIQIICKEADSAREDKHLFAPKREALARVSPRRLDQSLQQGVVDANKT